MVNSDDLRDEPLVYPFPMRQKLNQRLPTIYFNDFLLGDNDQSSEHETSSDHNPISLALPSLPIHLHTSSPPRHTATSVASQQTAVVTIMELAKSDGHPTTSGLRTSQASTSNKSQGDIRKAFSSQTPPPPTKRRRLVMMSSDSESDSDSDDEKVLSGVLPSLKSKSAAPAKSPIKEPLSPTTETTRTFQRRRLRQGVTQVS